MLPPLSLRIVLLGLIGLLPARAAELRPAAVTWGPFSHIEQMVGAGEQWPFVQKYMDGFVMHGAYWINHGSYWGKASDAAVAQAEQALGDVLAKNPKDVSVETGVGAGDTPYDPAHPETMEAYKSAHRDIAKFQEFASHGIRVTKDRADWFPMGAAAVMAAQFQVASPREILALVTGADAYYGTVPGFDPQYGNWRQYVREVHQAFPDIAFGFDQAPCNFETIPPDPEMRKRVPWEALGRGYGRPLTFFSSRQPVLIHDQPVTMHIDFADLMMAVELSMRSWGIPFAAFEADTPYEYVVKQGKVDDKLMQFLIAIERMQQRDGFHSSKFINADPQGEGHIPNDAWDKQYHDLSLKFLELYQGAGGRSDQYILESWYHGPYTLFPETKDGTFSNLVRDAIRRVRGIDDQGAPFHASLKVVQAGAVCEVRVTNQGTEVNKGDCRATLLVRGESAAPLSVSDAGHADITARILAQGDADGWFVGGLEPGESRSFFVTLPAGAAGPATPVFRLYWNPQDPQALVRDSISLQIPARLGSLP